MDEFGSTISGDDIAVPDFDRDVDRRDWDDSYPPGLGT
jgi:hypothetical protein